MAKLDVGNGDNSADCEAGLLADFLSVDALGAASEIAADDAVKVGFGRRQLTALTNLVMLADRMSTRVATN
jgi:hypothetical protein